MALLSVLLATALLGQGPAPTKLAHTYVKDQKSVYALEVKLPDEVGQITAEITFVDLDTEGNRSISAPKIILSANGGETTNNLESPKTKFDERGLTNNLEFNDTGIAVIIPSILSYLPATSVEKDKEFQIKEKRENYTLDGTGKLIDLTEKDGKQLATIEYKLSLKPTEEAEPGVFAFKSVFEIATGQLVSSQGTVEIGPGQSMPIIIKRK
jgi:hypothetical protein